MCASCLFRLGRLLQGLMRPNFRTFIFFSLTYLEEPVAPLLREGFKWALLVIRVDIPKLRAVATRVQQRAASSLECTDERT